ncbi:uncharacterized protein LOC129609215 [Condylostylus longicornis]|uniref:uncharacterized protein LOC129609215 n=1 Tax=Condylostylus longicornis TaxID=2530218 RepID=UPI00244E1BCE|nr:uncharacterized protein LOC129609215 [Condylostylus longicornis]
MNMSISNEFMEIWLDCDIVYKKLVQREDQLTLLKLFEKSIMVFFSFFEDDTKFVMMELKKYEIMKQKLPESLDGESCDIPKSTINKNVVSPLELTPIFGRKYEQNIPANTATTNNKENDKPKDDAIFYRFNNPVERFVKIPESFTEKSDSKNFVFEIIFRHKGNIEGQMTLLQLRNDKDDDLQSININSGKIITYIWNSKNGYQDARAIIKDVDIYDGNWHRLQIELIVKKESSSIWQKIRGKDNYSKKIKFYLDCELIGEDTLTDTLPFNTVQQTGVFFKNSLANTFADFDVKSLQMKDNYEQISCIKVH